MNSSVVTLLNQTPVREAAIFGAALIAISTLGYHYKNSVISVLCLIAHFGQSKYNKLAEYVGDGKPVLNNLFLLEF